MTEGFRLGRATWTTKFCTISLHPALVEILVVPFLPVSAVNEPLTSDIFSSGDTG
jgi:hypothetical protein